LPASDAINHGGRRNRAMATRGTLLVGYDVEKTTECAAFLERMADIHEEMNAPCTVFALGSCLLAEPDAFEAAAENPLIDMAQHTWSHIPLKTVVIEDGDTVEVIRGGSLEQIRDEVARASQAIESICGVSCCGITGPWAYYRGLADRPDVLEILYDSGIRYVRSYGRNEKDFQPVSTSIQPFWYAPQGFPDVLECMVHGWNDIYLRSKVGWSNLQGFLDQMKADLDHAAERGLVFSWGSHDWSSLREDPSLSLIRGILSHARSLGMQVLNYRQFWARMDALRTRAGSNRKASALA
ncbi:MAG: polysaccharide deacetylase family protein, partial [Armatimonadota bacterium]